MLVAAGVYPRREAPAGRGEWLREVVVESAAVRELLLHKSDFVYLARSRVKSSCCIDPRTNARKILSRRYSVRAVTGRAIFKWGSLLELLREKERRALRRIAPPAVSAHPAPDGRSPVHRRHDDDDDDDDDDGAPLPQQQQEGGTSSAPGDSDSAAAL
eukprot:m51a1_g4759 hypothetical protein (158) ;mRNA; f:432096-432790